VSRIKPSETLRRYNAPTIEHEYRVSVAMTALGVYDCLNKPRMQRLFRLLGY
jgi:hypothetical protein